MKKTTRNLLAVGGVMIGVFGLMGFVPSVLRNSVGFAVGSVILVIIGILMLAVAFGD